MANVLEKTSYIAVILTCLVLSGSLVYDRTAQTVPRSAAELGTGAGQHLELSDIDWKAHRSTVVLVLSTTCHFCRESSPFFRRLAELSKDNPKIGLVALFPQQVNEAAGYLRQEGIGVTVVRSTALTTLPVQGTPTMFLVGSDGIVKQAWEGLLNKQQQDAALAAVRHFS